MRVTSTVNIDYVAINQLNGMAKTALELTAEALHTEVVQAQVVPKDTGNLQNEAMFIDTSRMSYGMVSIVHSTPYARRLYYHPEYNFHRGEWFDEYGNLHEGNIAAGGKWFEPWINGQNKDFCPKTFERIYRRLLRGAR